MPHFFPIVCAELVSAVGGMPTKTYTVEVFSTKLTTVSSSFALFGTPNKTFTLKIVYSVNFA